MTMFRTIYEYVSLTTGIFSPRDRAMSSIDEDIIRRMKIDLDALKAALLSNSKSSTRVKNSSPGFSFKFKSKIV